MSISTPRHARKLIAIALVAAASMSVFAAAPSSTRGEVQESIVSVNLGQLMSGLKVFKKVGEQLRLMSDEIKTFNDAKQAELKAMQAELETLVVGSPAHTELQERLLYAAAELRSQLDVKAGLRDIEESKQVLLIYNKVVEAAAALAEQNGYDFILLDDTQIQFEGAPPQQTMAQLFTRRLIYANPDRDVTQELMTRMNNAFDAGTQ
jgi:Skp family chaperone for outer membrane proteins